MRNKNTVKVMFNDFQGFKAHNDTIRWLKLGSKTHDGVIRWLKRRSGFENLFETLVIFEALRQ